MSIILKGFMCYPDVYGLGEHCPEWEKEFPDMGAVEKFLTVDLPYGKDSLQLPVREKNGKLKIPGSVSAELAFKMFYENRIGRKQAAYVYVYLMMEGARILFSSGRKASCYEYGYVCDEVANLFVNLEKYHAEKYAGERGIRQFDFESVVHGTVTLTMDEMRKINEMYLVELIKEYLYENRTAWGEEKVSWIAQRAYKLMREPVEDTKNRVSDSAIFTAAEEYDYSVAMELASLAQEYEVYDSRYLFKEETAVEQMKNLLKVNENSVKTFLKNIMIRLGEGSRAERVYDALDTFGEK